MTTATTELPRLVVTAALAGLVARDAALRMAAVRLSRDKRQHTPTDPTLHLDLARLGERIEERHQYAAWLTSVGLTVQPRTRPSGRPTSSCATCPARGEQPAT